MWDLQFKVQIEDFTYIFKYNLRFKNFLLDPNLYEL